MVVESDTETSTRQVSDSECSSEDSAHFLAPSPPEPRDTRDAREPRDTRDKLVKSTSETDILYTIRKVRKLLIVIFFFEIKLIVLLLD